MEPCWRKASCSRYCALPTSLRPSTTSSPSVGVSKQGAPVGSGAGPAVRARSARAARPRKLGAAAQPPEPVQQETIDPRVGFAQRLLGPSGAGDAVGDLAVVE